MEQGSLEELVLTRSVTKHIKKQNKAFVQGTGVGHDFARSNDFIVTEAVAIRPEIAWVKAFNNFYVSGGRPLMARVVMLLPSDIREGKIKEYMNCINSLSEKEGVQLAGGHTEVNECYNTVSFVVTVTGISSEYSHRKKLIKPGADIIMTGYAGMLGTDLIASNKEKELQDRFSKAYISEQLPWKGCYSIKEAANILSGIEDVYYMHDVSKGGIHGALWQLGAYASKGISVGHFSIPIMQATIEYSELFGINPYLLEGTGAMLAVVRAGSGSIIADDLIKRGINAAVVGHIENGNERMVYLGEALSVETVTKSKPDEAAFFKDADNRFIERRCLSPVKGDEIYKLITEF